MVLFELKMRRILVRLFPKIMLFELLMRDMPPSMLFLAIMLALAALSLIEGKTVSILLSVIIFEEPLRAMLPSMLSNMPFRVFPLIMMFAPSQKIAGPLILVKMLFSIRICEEASIVMPAGVSKTAVSSLKLFPNMLMYEELEILIPVVNLYIFRFVMLTLFLPAMIIPLFPASPKYVASPIQLLFPSIKW